MRGFYRVYEDGRLVCETENLITTAGKKIIADYLAGNVSSWAGAIAVGSGNTAAAVGDTKLNFEYYRNVVSTKSVSYGAGTGGAHVITVKSVVDNDVAGKVYEMGIFSDEFDSRAGAGGGTILSYGDSTEPWYVYTTQWDVLATTPETTNQRVGADAVTLGTGNYRFAGTSLDLSAYSPADVFEFCMEVTSGTVTAVTIRFNTDDSNYFTYSPAVATVMNGTTYTTSSIAKSNWTAVGTPDWANITSIEIQTTGTNTFFLDGIRITDTDTNNPSYALVSRSVLTTPITKSDGSQMEIEYYLEY